MFIHFSKQKDYILSALNPTIDDLEKNGEEAFYAVMMGEIKSYQIFTRKLSGTH